MDVFLEVIRFDRYLEGTVIKSHSLQHLAYQWASIDFSVVEYCFSFPTLEFNDLHN